MAMVFKIILLLAVLYLLVTAGANRIQRLLMYIPETDRVSPAEVGLEGVLEVVLPVDGASLIAWWSEPEPSKPTLLYFHGNAGSLATRAERYRLYQQKGFGVLMVSYRGYGGSDGEPSERNNIADAKKAYKWLIDTGINASDIIVYGESLGSGVAVQLAAGESVGGVILDAPYTSMLELAELLYPILPSRLFMTDRYQSIDHIDKVSAPVLIIHGERDGTVPAEMGRRLTEKANEPKRLIIFPNAGHTDHYSHGAFEAVLEWVDDVRGQPAGLARQPKSAAE